jgi:DsbC/DsbD-like thiol-disulfide interchange protein
VIVAIVLAAGWVFDAQAAEPSPTPAAEGPVTVAEVAPVKITAGASSAVHVPVRVADGHRVQANPASNEFLVPLQVEIEDSDGLVFGPPIYPEAEPYRLEGADEDLDTYAGEIEVVVPVSATATAAPGDHSVMGQLRYQACNPRMCLFPASVPVELQIVVTASKGDL